MPKKIKTKKTASERKADIVRVAITLFSQKGFGGTTTRKLAKKAGVSEALLFRHFPNKKSLYQEILSTKMNERCHSLVEGMNPKASLHETLLEIAIRMAQQNLEDPTFYRLLLFSALEGHELSDLFFQQRNLPLLDFLIQFFKRMMNEKKTIPHDPEISSRAFLNLIHGYLNTLTLFKIPQVVKKPVRETLKTYVTLFTEGLKP